MSEPRRLMDESPSSLEAALLRAGKREAPSAAARAACAAAGLAVRGTQTASLEPAPKPSLAKLALKVVAAKGTQVLVAGALVTGIGAGIARLAAMRAPLVPTAAEPANKADEPVAGSGQSAPIPVTIRAQPVPTGQEVYERAPTAAPLSKAPAPPPAPRARKRSPRNPETTAPVARVRLGLGDEVKAFESAHRAFLAGDVRTAASALADYQTAFPDGALALEAELLQIEILVAEGNLATARTRAAAFLQAHPSAPAGRRLSGLLGDRTNSARP